MSQPTRLLSVTAAAGQLDCSRGHIYGLIAAGKLHAVDIAATGTRAKTRVLASEIEDFIAKSTRRAGGGASEARP